MPPNDRPARQVSCPLCCTGHQGCERKMSHDRCRGCSNQYVENIVWSKPCPINEIISSWWGAEGPHRISLLDTQGLDTSTLNIVVHQGSAVPVEHSIHIAGHFDVQNKSILNPLDKFILENFSPKLKSNNGDNDLVSMAVIADGYLRFLCSTTAVDESVRIIQDGHVIPNQGVEYKLGFHFHLFLIRRYKALVENVLDKFRQPHSEMEQTTDRNIAYTAIAVMQVEVEHFRSSLRNGYLSKQVPESRKGYFLNWLHDLEREMRDRLRHDCGRSSGWGLTINGSFKDLKCPDETLRLVMRLQQNKFGLQEPTNLSASAQLHLNNDSGQSNRLRKSRLPSIKPPAEPNLRPNKRSRSSNFISSSNAAAGSPTRTNLVHGLQHETLSSSQSHPNNRMATWEGPGPYTDPSNPPDVEQESGNDQNLGLEMAWQPFTLPDEPGNFTELDFSLFLLSDYPSLHHTSAPY